MAVLDIISMIGIWVTVICTAPRLCNAQGAGFYAFFSFQGKGYPSAPFLRTTTVTDLVLEVVVLLSSCHSFKQLDMSDSCDSFWLSSDFLVEINYRSVGKTIFAPKRVTL
jgi:hypothetical protein